MGPTSVPTAPQPWVLDPTFIALRAVCGIARQVWEHNGRAPLEHDGEWLSAEVHDADGNGHGQHSNVPEALLRDGQQQAQQANGGLEPVASSRDCIRQAKRGAMEVTWRGSSS
jgi:hypothetical protein